MGQSYRAIITIQEPIDGGTPIRACLAAAQAVCHPGHRPPGQGRPPRPDQGLPGGGGHPDQGLPQPPHAGHLPVWPIDPDHPIAPPSPGHPLPPVDPPPGTIWPPLPPGEELPEGKAVVLVAIEGVGYRYVVVQIGDSPDQELAWRRRRGPDRRRRGGASRQSSAWFWRAAAARSGLAWRSAASRQSSAWFDWRATSSRPGLPPAPQPKPVGRR